MSLLEPYVTFLNLLEPLLILSKPSGRGSFNPHSLLSSLHWRIDFDTLSLQQLNSSSPPGDLLFRPSPQKTGLHPTRCQSLPAPGVPRVQRDLLLLANCLHGYHQEPQPAPQPHRLFRQHHPPQQGPRPALRLLEDLRHLCPRLSLQVIQFLEHALINSKFYLKILVLE